jgi:hypothetical protein
MSGKNQHYIPQSLLRAFRIGPGKIARVFKFQAEGIFPLPTKQVAAEDWYYSHLSTDGSKTLDDRITDHEGGQLTADFEALYAAPAGFIEAALAARTIGHLYGRVDHVRGVVRTGAELLADMIEQLFGGEDELRYILGTDSPLPGKRFREAFGNAMKDETSLAAFGLPAHVLESISYMILREQFSSGMTEFNDYAMALAGVFREKSSTMARDAQVKSLTTSLLPSARVNLLECLDWSVIDVSVPSFILPDFVALARNALGETGTLLTFGKEEITTVLMPLSPTRMLVGKREDGPDELDLFNQQAATHCLAFFVSSFKDEALEALQGTIGQKAFDPIHEALAEAATDFRRQVEDADSATTGAPTDWDPELPASFTLEMSGYDDASREATGAVLMRLVAWARLRFDVSRLIVFVIAEDYERALGELNRGNLDTGEPVIPSKQGYSVAYNVPIERDGRLGIAIVLRPGIPNMLLGDDDEHYAVAAGIVLAQLARLGADALLEKVYAGGGVAGDACDRAMAPRTQEVWRSYFIGLYQSAFGEGVREEYRASLLAHLNGMEERLTEARRAYHLDNDAGALIARALPDAMGAVSLAGLASAYMGTDPDEMSIEAFRSELAARGLLNWFELLTRDFAEIWSVGNPYPDQEAFLVINRHAQRMLLTGQIFYWESEQGINVMALNTHDVEWLSTAGK